MTIATNTNESPLYLTNGVTTSFDFDFKVDAPSTELKVYELTISTDLEVLLTHDVDYSVTHDADKTGSITYPKTGGPEATGKKLRLVREVAETQNTDLKNQSGYRGEQHESVFDKLVMMVQQLSSKINRSIRLPVTSALADLTFPSPSGGKIVAWKADESGLENVTPTSTISLPLSLANGGLGAAHATISAIRQTLGLVIGTDVEAANADILKADETDNLNQGYTYDIETITFAASYTPDIDLGFGGEMTVTANITINRPSNTEGAQWTEVWEVDNASGVTVTAGTGVTLKGDDISSLVDNDIVEMHFNWRGSTKNALHVIATKMT